MSEAVLEEYRALREEILLHLRLRRQVVALSGSLFFVVLGFLAQSKDLVAYDLWGILCLLILLPLIMIYRYEVFAIARIASYIERFIEPRVEGLTWTRANVEAASHFNRWKREKWATRWGVLSVPFAYNCLQLTAYRKHRRVYERVWNATLRRAQHPDEPAAVE